MGLDQSGLQSAFDRYVATIDQIASNGDWSAYADLFTEDATYREHAFGDFTGREEIRTWIVRTMTSFPGSAMTGFPPAWHVLDVPTNRVICEVRNVMPDPGDGSVHEQSNLTILTFDDAGDVVRQEDVYNPQRFADMTRRWCQVADQHGRLDDEGKAVLAALGG